MVYYWDMDGVLCNFHKEPYKYENAINRQWIAHLEPFTYNIQVLVEQVEQGAKVYILTKAASDEAKQGKLDWIAKHIPQFDTNNFICIVGNGRKVDYIREAGTLIDDDKRNTTPWLKAGYPFYLLAYKGQKVEL